jgi:hypothetical protein
MKRLLILLMIAAALPLAGCTSLVDAAKEKCQAAFPKGSAAYETCWHREFERELRLQSDYIDELSRAARSRPMGR